MPSLPDPLKRGGLLTVVAPRVGLSVAVALLLGAVSSGAAVAGPSGPNPLCRRAFVGAFEVEGLERFPDGTDYCRVAEQDLPPPIREALTAVAARDAQVAAFFHLSVQELFTLPLRIALRGDPTGPLASSASPVRRPRTGIVPLSSLVTMTVFPDWPAGIVDSTKVLSPGIYLHELGHVISYNRDNRLPTVIHELASTDLFTESFADTLALAGAGTLFDAVTLPTCLRAARIVTDHDSYDEPYGAFDLLESRRRVVACCDEPANAADPDARVRGACDFMRRALRREYPVVPAFDASALDPATAYAIPPRASHIPLDPHQIGIPLNSFLLELSRETGRGLEDLYLSALLDFSLEKPGVPDPGTRNFAALGHTLHAHRLRDVFRVVRASLLPRDVAVFDRLWKKHGLEKAMRLADASDDRGCQTPDDPE